MSWNKFYVYQYVREDGSPFYIGKGSKNRINESHAPYVSVPAPEFRKVVNDNLTEDEAYKFEVSLIKKYKRKIDGGILENKKISRGGYAGWNHSDETKQKISEANSGKVRTEKHKENYKKPKTAEHAEKIRQANLGRPRDNRYEKIGLTKSKQRWFNNGTKSIMVIPGTEPKGFIPGRIGWSNNK